MTYGELRRVSAGWVTSHVIDDACSNAQWAFGKKYRDMPVSEYDISQIIGKAIHFGEPVPTALVSLGGAE